MIENSRQELDAYLQASSGLGESSTDTAVQRAYMDLLQSFGFSNPKRPLYTTFVRVKGEESADMFPDALRAPVGLLFVVHYDTAYVPEFDYSQLLVRLPARIDARTRENLDRYRYSAATRARYLARRGRQEEAQHVVDWYRSTFTDLR